MFCVCGSAAMPRTPFCMLAWSTWVTEACSLQWIGKSCTDLDEIENKSPVCQQDFSCSVGRDTMEFVYFNREDFFFCGCFALVLVLVRLQFFSDLLVKIQTMTVKYLRNSGKTFGSYIASTGSSVVSRLLTKMFSKWYCIQVWVALTIKMALDVK